MTDVTETSEDTELPTPSPWIVDYMDGGIYSAASGDPRDLRLIATLDLKAWEVQAGDLCPENRANARLIENAMPMKATLAEGAEIAARVVACWSSGDLAGAVNALEEWANGAAALVAEIEVSVYPSPRSWVHQRARTCGRYRPQRLTRTHSRHDRLGASQR